MRPFKTKTKGRRFRVQSVLNMDTPGASVATREHSCTLDGITLDTALGERTSQHAGEKTYRDDFSAK